MKRHIITFSIILISITSLQAQIYTQNGIIAGASTTNNVGIGTNTPSERLTIVGVHSDTRFLLHSVGSGIPSGEADLTLWASEPGLTYTGVGIGNNIQNYTPVNGSLKLLNSVRGGSYVRLLDNAMSLNVVSSLGVDKQALTINSNGNIGIGNLNPNSKLDLGNGYGANGVKFLIYNDDTTNEMSGTKCGFYMDNFRSNNLNLVFPEAGTNPGLFTISGKDTSGTTLKPYFSIAGLTGNMGVGTINPDEKLTVKGKIHAEEVRIDLTVPAPDYVFANDYKLKSLQEVETYIKQNNHLPEIPSAKEIEKNGLMLAEMNMSLLKKMEEMTLYMIEMKKENQEMRKENQEIKKDLLALKSAKNK